MTYLEVINSILRRLREDTVVAVSETDYSEMVGDFVNDAKRIVEDSYQWEALRTEYSVTTTAGTHTYTLTGLTNRAKIINVCDETSAYYLENKPLSWVRNKDVKSPSQTGTPKYYAYNGLDSAGDTLLRFWTTPDASYDISVYAVVPQSDLTLKSDVLKVPSAPVIHLALAMLARERGETGGTSTAEYFQMADKYLRDAIAVEAARHEDELVYFTV
jgi:hypothetical protein